MPSSPTGPPDFAVFTDREERTIIKPLTQRAIEWMLEHAEVEESVSANWHEITVTPLVFMENMPGDFMFAFPTIEELFGVQKGLH